MPTTPDLADVLDNLHDGVYFVDRERVITYWNKGAERITGYAADEVIGRSCRDGILNHVTVNGVLLCGDGCPLLATMADGAPRAARVFLHHKDGHRLPVEVRAAPLRDADGTVVGAVESFTADHALREARAEVRRLRAGARTDTLTGIGNRAFVEGRLHALLAEAAHHGASDAAVAMIDVDRFKDVNDTYGHDVGDRVLRMVAATLKANVRATDAVGRWGGEEFLVLLADVGDLDDVRTVADKLRTLVRWARLDLDDGRSITVTLSIGVTRLRPGESATSLVNRADELMYASKHAGRDRVTVG